MQEKVQNLDMFVFTDESFGSAELFPEVWQGLEMLISDRLEERTRGFDVIEASSALGLSPVVAYVAATRLQDPDLALRFRVVQALGGLLRPEEKDSVTPKSVRQAIKQHMMMQRRRGIWCLLQVSGKFMVSEPNVKALLALNPFAGKILAGIMSDRKAPLDIRHQAIVFAGQVGFCDTIPTIERLVERMESRANGQSSMSFVKSHPKVKGENELLVIARTTLELLKKP